MSTPRRHAEIAGGGIAGLAAAIALAQRNWSVRVYERGSAVRPEGAGIYIWENGLRVLTALGAHDAAVAGCHRGWMRETRNDANRVVAVARWSTEPGRRVVSIARLQLLGALHDRARELGVEVVFGQEVAAATPQGEIVLQDGTRRKADLVVAADGINSKVRDSLGLLRSRRRHADGAFRIMIPRTEAERQSEDGQKYAEYWSGVRRVLYTPCNANDLYLALTTLERDTEGQRVPLDKAAWTRSFPHLASLIERIGDSGRWDVFETVKLKQWSSGRVAIVGDAAHAQAPNLGQGGGCSLMNSLALAVALEHPEVIGTALANWEQRERPLTEHTQRVSAMYSKVTTLPPLLRSVTLSWLGKSKWAMEQRLRTAFHVPTGTVA